MSEKTEAVVKKRLLFWQEVQACTVNMWMTTDGSNHPDNRTKNRYNNILACEYSSFKTTDLKPADKNDFYNPVFYSLTFRRPQPSPTLPTSQQRREILRLHQRQLCRRRRNSLKTSHFTFILFISVKLLQKSNTAFVSQSLCFLIFSLVNEER